MLTNPPPISAAKCRSQPYPKKIPVMRADLIEEAKMVITEPPILINMVSKRVAQLNRGRRPLIDDTIGLSTADIALKEIIDGLIVVDEGEE